jgi:glyoxylate reductase
LAKPTVLLTRRLPQAAIDILGRDCEVVANQEDRPYPPDELASRAADVDAIVTVLSDKIDAAFIHSLRRCRVIANVAVGFDNINTEAAKRAGITITNTPGVLTDATADFAMTLLLAVARRVLEADRFVREGNFHGWNMMMLLGADLAGKTLGLAGFGRIGQAVARRAGGFGLRIVYADEHRFPIDVEQHFGTRFVDKETLLRTSDFLSLHLPLTPQTRHYIGAAELAKMKPSAYIINTSRGAAIDEAALVTALREKKIAGAGLDVYENEPALAAGLAELDNVVLAPHIASAGETTRTRMATMAAESVLAVLHAKEPVNRVV